MERLEIDKSDDHDDEDDDSIQGNEEPIGCSTEGTITFLVGLCAGTFSALLCKV